jgi:hypothetical protein
MDRALILTTCGIFEPPAESLLASPLTVIGGLSLFQRTIFTLQRGGISRFVVLAGDDTEALREQLQGDPRLTAMVRWLPIREFPPSDPRTWEVLSGILGGAYLVSGTGAIFPASLIAHLRAEAVKGEALVLSREARLEQTGTSGRWRADAPDQVGSVVTLEPRVSVLSNLNLVWLPDGFVSPGWATLQDFPQPLKVALERGLQEGRVRVVPLAGNWYQEVRPDATGRPVSPEEIARAERILLCSPKSALEGFVDHYFNRKCSTWLTKWLVQTPLTPNAVTLLATGVGLLAAAAFAVGGYAAGILGAVLFQLSAILDCCDGEVARMKFLESPIGERLDLILDNVVHVALFAGIAWGVSRTGWGHAALLLGGLAIIGNVASFGVVKWALRARKRLGDERGARIDDILDKWVSRDFSVLALALALLGHIDWFLVLAAIGANIFAVGLAWQVASSNISSRSS